MVIASRTPEGEPNRCPVCGQDLKLEPSEPTRDAPCPHCGHLLWFAADEPRDKSSVMEQRTADVLKIGALRFGPPDPTIRAAIESIRNPERLKVVLERVLSCKSWRELVDAL